MHGRKRVAYILIASLFLFAGTGTAAYGAAPNPFKVVIDPGHGGKDPGAIGINGLYEKYVNLDIARRVKSLLEDKGYTVVMTRETDKYLDLQARVEIAAREQADLFVSIHANSYPGSGIGGTMVLYYNASKYNPAYQPHEWAVRWSEESKKLAEKILQAVTVKAGTRNLGLVSSNVYVVRRAAMPGVLVETAFLSNREEAAKLASPEFRQRIAEGISEGILAYEPARFVDVVDHWARKEIVALSLEGIIQGYPDKTFRPDQGMTRAELVSLLEQATGFEGTEERQPAREFPDVPNHFWAYGAIMKAQAKGIVQGYHDGLFRPYRPVTREELAAILYRYFLEKGAEGEPATQAMDGKSPAEAGGKKEAGTEEARLQGDQPSDSAAATETEAALDKNGAAAASDSACAAENPFADVPQSHWAREAILSLHEAGVIEGIAPGRFGLGKVVTRAEAAAMLSRILNQVEQVE